jgi:hypothetical protein
MTKKTHLFGIASVLGLYLGLGLIYGLVVPPFENLDEIEHVGVVSYIANTGHLPVHGISEANVYHYRQEASQPPLYHLLSAGLVRVLGLPSQDLTTFWRFNPRVVCGADRINLYDNRAVFYHNPNQEEFPWQGVVLTVHVLRIWSTLLQAVTVIGTYALARLAFPQREIVGLLAMAAVAFNPQFLLVASGVNNDNLVAPLVTISLCLLLQIWRNGLSVRKAVGMGILTGLAGLSKLSGWALLGLAGLVTLAMVVRSKDMWKQITLTAAPIPVLALSLTGWWFWRNWQLYGDLTALQPMLEIVGVRGTSPIQPFLEINLMFRSFWGQIPCSFYPAGFYTFYTVLTALAFGSLVWNHRRFTSPERSMIIILAAWFLLILASWLRWDMMTPAPGGRLLFPALPAVALLMALGMNELTPGQLRWPNGIVIGLMALMAGWTALCILPGFFTPPPRYSDAHTVTPDHTLDATFSDDVRLMGYDAVLDAPSAGGPSESNPILDVTLYWQALAPMTEDYVLALQLVSPVPGDTTLRWNYNSWPGHGNYPTSAWQPSEVIADHYRFRLPETDFPTQAWDVYLTLYQNETGDRLPVHLGEVEVGRQLMLTRLRVPGREPLCPEEGALSSEVHFGEEIALTHALVVFEREEARVSLCWEALRSPSADYTVFVHLEDASGDQIGTGDGPPMRGAYPTSMWHPGDVILDDHPLAITAEERGTEWKAEATGARITVGLYKLGDGSRLPAYVQGHPVPHAAVVVWPNHP